MAGIVPNIILVLAGVLVGAGNVALLTWFTRRKDSDQPVSVAPRQMEQSAPPPIFAALASVLEDGLLVVEQDRSISYTNEAAGELLGTSTSTLESQSVMAALREYAADQAIERALTTGEAQSTVFTHTRTRRTFRLSAQRFGEPGSGVVVVLRDLTRLAHLERARREMVANVSHELATPLASVRLLVETLLADPPPEIARRMLGQIDDELLAMTQLIEELRELSQIESGRLALRLRPAAIVEIATRAVERLRPQATRKALTLETEFAADLPRTMIDEDRIGQVLLNLLHNAVKWTPEGGRITVSACPAADATDGRTKREFRQMEGTGWLRVRVQDTGIGIPSDQLDRVFERFYKVDRARTRDGGGTGLGLAIAKHLVERHGGRIWVESVEGEGSTFSMLLPTATESGPARP